MRISFLICIWFLGLLLQGCSDSNPNTPQKASLLLNTEQANRLAALPLKCLQQEYPNKLGQVLNDAEELKNPKQLHPAFYGCFDWHSSVHGHWLLVTLLKEFPQLKNREEIRAKLNQQLTKANIETELAFFKTKYNQSFERTYGWNWILKLQLELETWEDEDAKNWANNLRPLSDFICQGYIDFLPKLVYPIRTGDHINTAFGFTFAYDYAAYTDQKTLLKSIKKHALRFFEKDKNTPFQYEPSGYDFLSPSLEEIEIMERILTPKKFRHWLEDFYPELSNPEFKLEPGKVIDRTDGKLVHLDGLNFSRAWCLYRISRKNKTYAHLKKIADDHVNYSLKSITDGDYMGEHWLASFALMALIEKSKS